MTISEKALCAALLGAMATPAGMVILPANAQEAAVRFELPAQDLATTLRTLARQAGREILFADEDVRGLRAPAVRGSLTVEQAVRLAIRGRGLIVEDQAGALVVRVRPQAAEADATEITVTGTRIRGANGPSPVIVMTRRQLEEQGLPDMASISRIIPQNFTGGQNLGVAGGGDQGGYNNINNATTLNLRGLGSDATLTLINGHRLPYDGVNQGVDISIIPLAALDRVEVIADGASALYGSDAVGGVANLLLRRDYDGLQTSARVGASTDGGNVQQQYSGVGGRRWTGGGFMVAIDYSKATPKRRLRRQRHAEPIMIRRFDQPLAGETMQCIANGGDARSDLLADQGGLDRGTGRQFALGQHALELVVDPLEGGTGTHGGSQPRCPATCASISACWSGRSASIAPIGSVGASWSRIEGHWPS